MPLRYRQRLLDHLSHRSYVPGTRREIMRELRIEEPEDREIFDETIRELTAEGLIVAEGDGVVRLQSMPEEITGILRMNARGFGFIIPDTPYREGDLFVPQGESLDAVTGDHVRARVRRQAWRERMKPGSSGVTGSVVEVLKRKRTQFAGTLRQESGRWYVDVDGRELREPLIVRDPHAKNASAGDKVVIDVIAFPDDRGSGEAVITRVLGEAGRPDVETEAVMEAHGLRRDFSEAVIAEATDAARRFEAEIDSARREREDLTERFVFTIDPTDSKDFDDAITLEYDESDGSWELGVHIADVAHFVRPGSALDEEAKARGNSVYLPRVVLPMLPEVLSNGVCSLQEGVERFTKSVFIRLGPEGEVLGQRLSSTIIRSAKRLTYLEAQALINGDIKQARIHARTDTPHTEEIIEKLRQSDRLARIIRKRRQGQGMIALALPEVELTFDEKGHVNGAQPEDDSYTHTIIEMFMVEANEALARTFSTLNVPVLRRIHPEPAFADIEELRTFALAARYRLPDEPTRKDVQALLDHTRESPAARAIHFAVLRTLTRASYSPAIIGHFALASEHYAHFTSPIRRYPDLTLHRAVEAYLELTDNGTKPPGGRHRAKIGALLREDDRIPSESEMVVLGRHCSDMEKNAADAEQSLRAFLVLQFLSEQHLGDEFTGVITGMTRSMLFVSLEQYLVDGVVPVSELPGSKGREARWDHDRTTGRLVAARGGGSLGIGDLVQVRIVQIDLASREMSLLLTEMPQRDPNAKETPWAGRGGGKGKGSAKGRGKPAKGSKGKSSKPKPKGKRRR